MGWEKVKGREKGREMSMEGVEGLKAIMGLDFCV
jgi:hypothetical protein